MLYREFERHVREDGGPCSAPRIMVKYGLKYPEARELIDEAVQSGVLAYDTGLDFRLVQTNTSAGTAPQVPLNGRRVRGSARSAEEDLYAAAGPEKTPEDPESLDEYARIIAERREAEKERCMREEGIYEEYVQMAREAGAHADEGYADCPADMADRAEYEPEDTEGSVDVFSGMYREKRSDVYHYLAHARIASREEIMDACDITEAECMQMLQDLERDEYITAHEDGTLEWGPCCVEDEDVACSADRERAPLTELLKEAVFDLDHYCGKACCIARSLAETWVYTEQEDADGVEMMKRLDRTEEMKYDVNEVLDYATRTVISLDRLLDQIAPTDQTAAAKGYCHSLQDAIHEMQCTLGSMLMRNPATVQADIKVQAGALRRTVARIISSVEKIVEENSRR